MSVITLDEVSQHVIKQITWNPNLVDGTYDCACLSNDDEDEEEAGSVDEHDLEMNESVSRSSKVLRLKGGGAIWLTDELDDYNREEVIEWLRIHSLIFFLTQAVSHTS